MGCGITARHTSEFIMDAKKSEIVMTWASMMTRCYSPSASTYKGYGSKGITVSEYWHNFDNFASDMGDRPTGCTLDRIDNRGNYEAGNCRWATITQQNRNKSDNVHITIDGETKLMIDWSRQYGVSQAAISVRLKLGWDHKDAVTRPARAKRPHVRKPRNGPE